MNDLEEIEAIVKIHRFDSNIQDLSDDIFEWHEKKVLEARVDEQIEYGKVDDKDYNDRINKLFQLMGIRVK